MIKIDLSKQQNTWCLYQGNTDSFTGNLSRVGNTTMFFIVEIAKETILQFSLGTVRVLWILFCSNVILI